MFYKTFLHPKFGDTFTKPLSLCADEGATGLPHFLSK